MATFPGTNDLPTVLTIGLQIVESLIYHQDISRGGPEPGVGFKTGDDPRQSGVSTLSPPIQRWMRQREAMALACQPEIILAMSRQRRWM